MGTIILVGKAICVLGASDVLAELARPYTTKIAAKVVAWVKE